MTEEKSGTYLGLDLSTQALKGVVANEDLELLYEVSVSFDKDLPQYGTTDGVTRHEDGKTVTSPTLMWVEAIDILLEKMKAAGVDFFNIKALSGSGQQHGTVYWRKSSKSVLKGLDSKSTLREQLKGSFTIMNSPIWMDASTTKYCQNLEATFEGSLGLAKVTGSCGYERFSGNQIAKIYAEHKSCYDACEQISLVSSFLTSIFIGGYAAIDLSDGSGMNLLNISTRQWEQKALDACAPDLKQRLMTPLPSASIAGKVSSYMVERYGFSPDCSVVTSTGDNPSSLAGMCLHKGDVAVSLGTSDTLILWTEKAQPAIEGHIFVNPVNESHYMAMLCFKNGSLARERIRVATECKDWEQFNSALERTKPGNEGNVGIYFFDTEIIPFAKGVYRWDFNDQAVRSFSNDIEARAIIEGQFIAKRVHAEKIGYRIDETTKILATGGASNNHRILQILSDVFNACVYVSPRTSNSACLGAVYRSKHALLNAQNPTSFSDVVQTIADFRLVASPNKCNTEVYNELCKRYVKLEGGIVNKP